MNSSVISIGSLSRWRRERQRIHPRVMTDHSPTRRPYPRGHFHWQTAISQDRRPFPWSFDRQTVFRAWPWPAGCAHGRSSPAFPPIAWEVRRRSRLGQIEQSSNRAQPSCLSITRRRPSRGGNEVDAVFLRPHEPLCVGGGVHSLHQAALLASRVAKPCGDSCTYWRRTASSPEIPGQLPHAVGSRHSPETQPRNAHLPVDPGQRRLAVCGGFHE